MSHDEERVNGVRFQNKRERSPRHWLPPIWFGGSLTLPPLHRYGSARTSHTVETASHASGTLIVELESARIRVAAFPGRPTDQIRRALQDVRATWFDGGRDVHRLIRPHHYQANADLNESVN